MSTPLIPSPTAEDKVLLVVRSQRERARISTELSRILFPIWRELIEFVHLDEYAALECTDRDRHHQLKGRLKIALGGSGAKQVLYPAEPFKWAGSIFTYQVLNDVDAIAPYRDSVAAHKDVARRLAKWKYIAIDETLQNTVSRHTNPLGPWIAQWSKLGLEPLGTAVAKSIQIVSAHALVTRLCPEAEINVSSTDLIPCYVILLEDDYDSNTLLKEHILTIVGRNLGVRHFLLLVSACGHETEYGMASTPGGRDHGPIDWERVSRLISIDEINVTGHKAYSREKPKSQLQRMDAIARAKQKPFVLRFAYSTEIALNYKANTAKWDAGFTSVWFKDIEVVNSVDELRIVSTASPMAFLYVPKVDWPDGERVGRYLSQSTPLGQGAMATTLLFCNVVPANTYPPLIKALSKANGSAVSPRKWKPLIVDSKRI